MKKKLFFFHIFIVIIFSINSYSSKSKLVYNLGAESKTIDPQLTTGSTGIKVDFTCMEGLVRKGKKTGQYLPGAAKSWDTNNKGKVWTFHLRKNGQWSNGTPLTAHDFYFGMKRALSPSTASEYAYLLYCIKNAEKYNKGELNNISKLGIEVVDKYTLKITLDEPCHYFLDLMAFPTAFPLDEKFFRKIGGDYEYALDEGSMIYNGPWKIEKWIRGGKMVFTKNKNYWNYENIKIDKLVYLMINDFNTALNMFKNNQLDITGVSGRHVKQISKQENIISYCTNGLWYLEFNTNNKFFKNKNIRKAFSLAINRKILCNKILKDGSKPAYAFVPFGIKGKEEKSFRESFQKELFNQNIKIAKKLLKKGLKEINQKKPIKVKLLIGNSHGARRNGQYIQEQLRIKLDVEVKLVPHTFQVRLKKMSQGNFDFVYAGWSPDYNDPMTFLNLFTADNGNNHGGFSNHKYDKLINKAKRISDKKRRMNILSKAERLLSKEMPVAPLYYSYRNIAVKPSIKDIVIQATGNDISFYWASIKK